jgi:ribosomal protein S18 acetylase RimI-like enzyme
MENLDENFFATYRPRDAASATPPPGLLFRPANITDLQQLAALCQERHRDDLDIHLEKFQKELTENPEWIKRLVLVAEAEGAIVGYGRAIYLEPPQDAPPNAAPAGWYLGGVIVSTPWRRRGIGLELTKRRLAWIAERTSEAFYFVNARNLVSIELHNKLGFEEVTRDFHVSGVSFTGGAGILFLIDLTRQTFGRQ